MSGKKLSNKDNYKEKRSKREGLAWTSIENRNFLKVRLGNLECRALFDPGANVSVISASIAEEFKDRLQPVDSWIESAMGEALKCLGQLKVNIVVDGVVDALFFKALEGVRHEMILGMDFIKKWDIEVKNKQTLWRVGETILQNGTWYPFSNSSTDGVSVFGECAGIFELTSKEDGRRRDCRKIKE